MKELLNLEQSLLDHIETDILACEKEMDDDSESIITGERYRYIGEIIEDCYKNESNAGCLRRIRLINLLRTDSLQSRFLHWLCSLYTIYLSLQ